MGLYGVNCSEMCGNCCDVKKCLFLNGWCLNECKVIYVGLICKICKYLLILNDIKIWLLVKIFRVLYFLYNLIDI